MTTRLLVAPAVLLVASVLAGCGAKSSQPTAQERDLGPASTKILGGAADGKYLHVFSASISTVAGSAPRFSATFLYVGAGSDRLVHVTTPLGTATLAQPLIAEAAVPITVPLRIPHGETATGASGSTMRVSVRLADHGGLAFTVPIVGPASAPTPTATASSTS
jgi:hypothetical protein